MQLHKALGIFKTFPIQNTTKEYNNSWCCTLHSTFNHRTQMNTTSPKNFFEVLQLNANGICNKTYKIQLLIKNTRADIIIMQETKLNQSYKTPNIYHFKPIRTDHTHKQGGGLLTYIKNNISFLQLNTSNPFLLKYKSSKSTSLHHSNYIPQTCAFHLAITNRRQTELISRTFTTKTNLSNTMIRADVNADLYLWYLPTENHRD